jgi:hypothetical protein
MCIHQGFIIIAQNRGFIACICYYLDPKEKKGLHISLRMFVYAGGNIRVLKANLHPFWVI